MRHLNSSDLSVRRKPEIDALTSARYFAALYVVFIHYISKIGGHPPALFHAMARVVAGTGPIPVTFFFVLSGFILSYNYISPEFEMRVSGFEFWRARFARLYPVYLAGFLLFLPVAIVKAMSMEGKPLAAIGLLLGVACLNLVLLQSWTPFAVFWNAPAWSLSVEAFFYGMFPIIAPRIFRRRWIANVPLTAALWILSLAAVFILQKRGESGLRSVFSPDYHPVIWGVTFLIGIVAAQAFLKAPGVNTRKYGAVSLALIALSALIICLVPSSFAPYLPLTIAPLFGVLIYTLSRDATSLFGFLSLRPLRLLGRASYSLYVIHVPLWNYFIPASNRVLFKMAGERLARPFMPANYAAHWLLFVVYIVISTLLSIACFHFIEEPMRRFLSAKTRDWASRLRQTRLLMGTPLLGDNIR